MEKSIEKNKKIRKKRAKRVRRKVKSTSDRPRLSILKTNKHLFVQLIDDVSRKSVVGLGTCSKSVKEAGFEKKSKKAAQHLGQIIAAEAKKKNIQEVVFDRGAYKYHGLVAAFADAARSSGWLKF